MKKIIFSLFFFSAIVSVQAQDKDKGSKSKTASSSMTYINANAKLAKFYTAEELNQLGKIELTQLYMERIVVLTELVPYIALHTKPGATLREMGIPETELNVDHMEKEVKNKVNYLAAVKNTLDDIVPYADKDNIVWAIMFLEDTIKKIEIGNEKK